MNSFGRCEEVTTQSRVSLRENRSRILFENITNNSLRIIRIDGCVFTDGIKCDYLLIDPGNTEYYIELKGHNVSYAAKQIAETIRRIHEDVKNSKKRSFIICKRSPLSSPEIQILQKKFIKDFNSSLTVKESGYAERI